jgi:hypothetical protein
MTGLEQDLRRAKAALATTLTHVSRANSSGRAPLALMGVSIQLHNALAELRRAVNEEAWR